jgi:hypothetical protein
VIGQLVERKLVRRDWADRGNVEWRFVCGSRYVGDQFSKFYGLHVFGILATGCGAEQVLNLLQLLRPRF